MKCMMLKGGNLVFPLSGLSHCCVGEFQNFILSWSMLEIFVDSWYPFEAAQMPQVALIQLLQIAWLLRSFLFSFLSVDCSFTFLFATGANRRFALVLNSSALGRKGADLICFDCCKLLGI